MFLIENSIQSLSNHFYIPYPLIFTILTTIIYSRSYIGPSMQILSIDFAYTFKGWELSSLCSSSPISSSTPSVGSMMSLNELVVFSLHLGNDNEEAWLT